MNYKVRNESILRRRTKGKFYSENDAVSYIYKTLNLKPHGLILEPSAGEGALIDPILEDNMNDVQSICIIDNDLRAYNYLIDKYKGYESIEVNYLDFLTFNKNYNIKFDYIIENPPFNLKISNRFGLGLSNSTDIFLYHSLQMLKENGRLIIILPGTFFRNKSYENIRKIIIERYKINNIINLSKFDFMDAKIEIFCLDISKSFTNHQTYYVYNNDKKNRVDYIINSRYFINLYNSVIDFKENIFEYKIGDLFNIYRGRSLSKNALKGKHISVYYNGINQNNYVYSYVHNNNNGKNIICLQNIAYRFVASYLPKADINCISDTITILEPKEDFSERFLIVLTTFLNSSIGYYLLHTYVFNYSRLTMHLDKYYVKDIPCIKASIVSDSQYAQLSKIVNTNILSKDRLSKINKFYYCLFKFSDSDISSLERKWIYPRIQKKR
jgi:tRNA1(Val) A37 N6-methylase TrmN6